jgi:AcrR family transcriptional regulator
LAKLTPKPSASDRIRETASDLFYRQGIRAVGVDEIVGKAGATKPSLYRAFKSKDALAVDYLNAQAEQFWGRFEGAVAEHPGDPMAQLKGYFSGLAARSNLPGFRGCGLSNAAVEFPEPGHPARLAAEAHKRELRARLAELAAEAGAKSPQRLADSLLLLIEGSFASVQLFGPGGPSGVVAEAADALIEAAMRG